jgi:hypothetical protein
MGPAHPRHRSAAHTHTHTHDIEHTVVSGAEANYLLRMKDRHPLITAPQPLPPRGPTRTFTHTHTRTHLEVEEPKVMRHRVHARFEEHLVCVCVCVCVSVCVCLCIRVCVCLAPGSAINHNSHSREALIDEAACVCPHLSEALLEEEAIHPHSRHACASQHTQHRAWTYKYGTHVYEHVSE